jgi:hypothetical protein
MIECAAVLERVAFLFAIRNFALSKASNGSQNVIMGFLVAKNPTFNFRLY